MLRIFCIIANVKQNNFLCENIFVFIYFSDDYK